MRFGHGPEQGCGRHHQQCGGPHHREGAQTFRRGRALDFLERLQVKRSTLKQQLDQPEYASMRQIISGELKAIDTVINEFVQEFGLSEATSTSDARPESSLVKKVEQSE